MTLHRVADVGDGIQIWRLAMNVLNKQSWTANKGWSSSLGVVRGADNSSPLINNLLRNVTQSRGFDGAL
jgi:hypothetical protein